MLGFSIFLTLSLQRGVTYPSMGLGRESPASGVFLEFHLQNYTVLHSASTLVPKQSASNHQLSRFSSFPQGFASHCVHPQAPSAPGTPIRTALQPQHPLA